MGMRPLHVLFPEEARKECRIATPMADDLLPQHAFLFMELYCNEKACTAGGS